MVSDISFTVYVQSYKSRPRIAIRESYRGRRESIIRDDIASQVASQWYLDEVYDAVNDAGWFVDRTSAHRDPEVMQMAANMIPRIPDESVIGREQYVFVARCMARNVPFSVAMAAWSDTDTDTSDAVTFAGFYAFDSAMSETVTGIEVA